MRIIPLDRNSISILPEIIQKYGNPDIGIYSMCGTIFHENATTFAVDVKASIYYVTYDFQNIIQINTTSGLLTFNMSDNNTNFYWGFDKAILII